MLKKISVLLLPLLTIAGCSSVTNAINSVNTAMNSYSSIVGSNLLKIGNIIVQAECSPATTAVGTAASNILSILASSSAAATTVATILATNTSIASQLCPLVSAIKASVGTVPSGTPTQVISTTDTSTTTSNKLKSVRYGTTVIINRGALPIIKTY